VEEVKAQEQAEKADAEEEYENHQLGKGNFAPIFTNKRLAYSQSQSQQPEAQSQSQSQGKQATLDKFVQIKKWPLQSDKQLEFDTILTLALVLANLPFSIVENPGIKMLLTYLLPKATIKSPTTLSKSKLPMLYRNLRKEVRKQLEKDIPHCKLVAFTTDGWTARNNDPFESLTVHYVTKDFELKKLSLDCQNFIARKTGVLLAKGLDSMISKFPIFKEQANLTKVCVTDGATNMKKALTYSDFIKPENHMVCADHNLNNALKVIIFLFSF